MSIQQLAKQFVDLCNQGKNFDVMNTLYAPTIVSVESDGKETAGQSAVIQKSKTWAEGITLHGEKVLGPFLSAANGNDGQFAVHFTFELTPKSTGKRITQEEIGVYTVKDDKIVREQFFNAGNW